MDLGLKDKKALVWGASQGIGYSIAKSLVKEGATVTVASRSAEKIKSAKDKLNADHAITLDLTKPGEAKKSIQKATELMGGLIFYYQYWWLCKK